MSAIRLAILLLALADPSGAAAGWESKEVYSDPWVKGAVWASVATHSADVYTTHRGLSQGYKETNIFLGDRPSDGELVLLKVAGFAGMVLLTEAVERSSLSCEDKLFWHRGAWWTMAVVGAIPAVSNGLKVDW